MTIKRIEGKRDFIGVEFETKIKKCLKLNFECFKFWPRS